MPHCHVAHTSHALNCRKVECTKNHVLYIKNRKGHTAMFEVVHFKTEPSKGKQTIPLAKGTVEVFMMLEKASHFYNTQVDADVTTMFHKMDGTTYKDAYFSTVASTILTIDGERCLARHFRHMFATNWRDFIQCPTTKLYEIGVDELEEAATRLTLTSPEAWDAAYDDTTIVRGMHTVVALWPKFKEFLFSKHLDKLSEVEWDPLTTTMADLA